MINFDKDAYSMGVPHNGTETSKEAAQKLKKKATKREIVYNAIKKFGGLTNEQISDMTGMPLSGVCGRCRELQLDGLVQDSGKRFKSLSGRNAVVWEVV